MWHFWYVEEIFAVPNHWMFNMSVVVAFMAALAYVVHLHALVELGAETPGKNPPAEMYKMALRWQLPSATNRKENALGRLELLYCYELTKFFQYLFKKKEQNNYLPKKKEELFEFLFYLI